MLATLRRSTAFFEYNQQKVIAMKRHIWAFLQAFAFAKLLTVGISCLTAQWTFQNKPFSGKEGIYLSEYIIIGVNVFLNV